MIQRRLQGLAYCWVDNPGAQKSILCADMAGVPTTNTPLIAASTPFTAYFHLPLDMPPNSLYIAVMPAVKEIDGSQENVRLWEPAGGWSGGLPLKNEVEYEFQETPGLYVFQLNVRWEKYGDVSYGFLIQVGPITNTPSLAATQSASIETPTAMKLSLISAMTRIGNGVVLTLKPSPDGQWLAIATSLGVYLYDMAKQKEVWFHQYGSAPRYVAFNPDSSRLSIGLASSVMPVVDVKSGKTVLELHGEEGIHGVWSPDGKSILTSAGCEQVLVWDAESGRITHALQASKCNNVEPGLVNAVWSWDGKRIYVNSNYGNVAAWDAQMYEPLAGYTAHPPEFAFGFDFVISPTQNVFALENGLSVAIANGETGKVVKELEAKNDPGPVNHIAWSPDGRQLLANNYLWKVETYHPGKMG